MSTYLVAYSINDFEYKESQTHGDVVFKTWARRDAISQVFELMHSKMMNKVDCMAKQFIPIISTGGPCQIDRPKSDEVL